MSARLDFEDLRKRRTAAAERYPGGDSWVIVQCIDEIDRLREILVAEGVVALPATGKET